ncbi:MAG: hypothetical protein IKY98_02360 [Alphaproteobacteria bacterium]|nr:hypothetical protein [Alphaproteobacteria bacterium]
MNKELTEKELVDEDFALRIERSRQDYIDQSGAEKMKYLCGSFAVIGGVCWTLGYYYGDSNAQVMGIALGLAGVYGAMAANRQQMVGECRSVNNAIQEVIYDIKERNWSEEHTIYFKALDKVIKKQIDESEKYCRQLMYGKMAPIATALSGVLVPGVVGMVMSVGGALACVAMQIAQDKKTYKMRKVVKSLLPNPEAQKQAERE